MAREPLTDQEERDLADIKAFNDGPGKQGWRLAGREIIERDFSGIHLQGAILEDVSLDTVGLADAEIGNSTFVKVDWQEMDLSGATFINVHFRECLFSGVDAGGTTFKGCVFETCRADNWSAVGADFVNCTFRKFEAEDLDFEDVTMKMVAFNQSSTLTRCNFRQSELDHIKYENCRIEEMIFTEVTVEQIHFLNGSIIEGGFSASNLTKATFHAVHLESVIFSESDVSQLNLQDCSLVEGLCLIKSKGKGVILAGGTQTKELSLIESEVDSLRIENCELERLEIQATDMMGENTIQGVTIGTCRFSKSCLNGLLIARSNFNTLLQLDNVYFNGLQLKGVKYSKDLVRQAQGVQYESSDQFSLL